VTNYRRTRKSQDDQLKRVLIIVLGAFAVLVLAVSAYAGLKSFSPPKPTSSVVTPSTTDAAEVATAPQPAEAVKPIPTEAPVAAPPAPKAAAAPVVPTAVEKTNPAKMAKIPGDTQQIIVITGAKLGSNSGTLELYNKNGEKWDRTINVKAYFGKNGLIDGQKRKTGNLETPTGIWEIGFLFGKPSNAPDGTKMEYRQIKENSYWSGVRDSTYNTWVNHKVSGEHLIDAMPQYYYAFNTGYNSPPNERVEGRGTAIFIHCSEPPGNALGNYTHGCIAIPREKMVELFEQLDPKKNPRCAIGTLKDGSSTSIWAY
jgi:L,D-peptidoglycan transpeptidase YkuD (ErfK/YbiS/YcfS/YnhG family)